jgi:hypothetical protein
MAEWCTLNAPVLVLEKQLSSRIKRGMKSNAVVWHISLAEEASLHNFVAYVECVDLVRARPLPTAGVNRYFDHSPVDTLMSLVVRGSLLRRLPFWHATNALVCPRILVIQQQRSANLCDIGRFRLHADAH